MELVDVGSATADAGTSSGAFCDCFALFAIVTRVAIGGEIEDEDKMHGNAMFFEWVTVLCWVDRLIDSEVEGDFCLRFEGAQVVLVQIVEGEKGKLASFDSFFAMQQRSFTMSNHRGCASSYVSGVVFVNGLNDSVISLQSSSFLSMYLVALSFAPTSTLHDRYVLDRRCTV